MVKSCWKIGTECPSHKCFCKVYHIPWHAMKVYDLWWHSVYNFDEGAPYDIRLNETIGALNHYRPPLHVDHNRDTFLATIFDDKLASDSSMLEEAIRKRFGEHLSNLMKRVSEKHPATRPSVQSSWSRSARGWNTQDSVSATAKSSNVQAPKRNCRKSPRVHGVEIRRSVLFWVTSWTQKHQKPSVVCLGISFKFSATLLHLFAKLSNKTNVPYHFSNICIHNVDLLSCWWILISHECIVCFKFVPKANAAFLWGSGWQL